MATLERSNERTTAWMAVLLVSRPGKLRYHRAVLAESSVDACVIGRALTGAGKREMIVRHTTAHFARLPIASAGTWPAADQVYHARQFGAPVTISWATLLSQFEACKDRQAVCSYLTVSIDYCTGYMPRTASIASCSCCYLLGLTCMQLERPTPQLARSSPHCLSEWLARTDTGFRQSRVMLAVLSIEQSTPST